MFHHDSREWMPKETGSSAIVRNTRTVSTCTVMNCIITSNSNMKTKGVYSTNLLTFSRKYNQKLSFFSLPNNRFQT